MPNGYKYKRSFGLEHMTDAFLKRSSSVMFIYFCKEPEGNLESVGGISQIAHMSHFCIIMNIISEGNNFIMLLCILLLVSGCVAYSTVKHTQCSDCG